MKLYNENFEIVDIDDAAVDKMKQFCWEPKEVECSPYTSYNGRATFAYCRDSGFVSRIIDGEYADFYETDKWAVDALAKAVMDDDYDDDVWYSMLPDGLAVMDAWGFEYKGNIIWEKVRKDGQPDGRGVGFYFRNVTEILLFGIKKRSAPNRTLAPARSQVNLIRTIKREHSRKPDEIIPIIEACSQGPRIELFARGDRTGWTMWGDQADASYEPDWATYKNHTVAEIK